MLDALRDSPITVTTCRQEGGAAMMAEAVGKATGRPGVCFVTRGPGATNASAGIHIAKQDSTPLIMFVGQIERGFRDREAFQELDYRAVFGSMTKWTTEIDDPDRIAELVSRAFYMATSGRPGPVVLALPKDMLSQASTSALPGPFEPVEVAPSAEDITRLKELISAAERPLFVIGGSRWTPAACANLRGFAERFDMPVMTSYRRSWLFDALHPCYAGDLGLAPNPKLVARVKAADLVIMLGGRLGEIPSQSYSLFRIPTPQTTFVHIHPGVEELGKVYRPTLAINASPIRMPPRSPRSNRPRKERGPPKRQLPMPNILPGARRPTPQPGGVNLGEVMVQLRSLLPADAILCNGAGNYAAWIHRFYRFRDFATHIAPTSARWATGFRPRSR